MLSRRSLSTQLGLVRAEPRTESVAFARSRGTAPADGASLSWPVLDVSLRAAPNEARYRARLELGTRRHADTGRIARAFTNLVVNVAEAPVESDSSHVRAAKWLDVSGNTVVEIRSALAGIPESLVTGLFLPIVQSHADELLERARELPAAADLVISMEVIASNAEEGGAILRVILHADPSGSAGATSPARAPAPAASPRRFDSGIRRREPLVRDDGVDEALAFVSGRLL